jgi:iron complex outermembrane receptor protein
LRRSKGSDLVVAIPENYYQNIKTEKIMKAIYKILLVALLQIIALSVAAQAVDTVINIEAIIIEAQSSNTIQKTTINSMAISIEDIHDVAEIFVNQPGFGIIKRGNYAMEPVMRGYKYEQLNVIYNGGATSSNACPNRMDPAISQISPEDIEKVEIIRGPYSMRYGQPFGGVINLVTTRPRPNPNAKAVSGSVLGGWESNGGNAWGAVNVLMQHKKVDFLLSADYKDFGNYHSGSGQEVASSFSRFGYDAKLGFNLADNHRIQINFRQGFAKDIMHAALPMDADKDNSTQLALDYVANNITSKISSLRMKLFGSYVDHEMSNDKRPNYVAVHAVTPVTALVAGGNAEVGLMTSSKNLIYLGTDFKTVAKDGTRTREVYINVCNGQTFDPPKVFKDLVWQNSIKNTIGFFAENHNQLHRDLLWITGARIDFTNYDARDVAPDFSEAYNGNIKPGTMTDFSASTSLTWQIDKSLELLWALGRGVRTPELYEMYINHLSIGQDAYEYLGNPNLKPEINYQTDLRVEKRWPSLSVYGNVYYSLLQNYISAYLDTTLTRKFLPCMPPPHAKRYINVPDAFMTGFEAGMEWQFVSNFKYTLTGGYTYAQNTSWDEPLPEIPPFSVSTSIGYYSQSLQAVLNARIASAQDRVAPSFDESTSTGFAVFDLKVKYLPLDFLEIYGAITNILNKNYVEHLSRAYDNMYDEFPYYEPGRSFNLGVKILF